MANLKRKFQLFCDTEWKVSRLKFGHDALCEDHWPRQHYRMLAMAINHIHATSKQRSLGLGTIRGGVQ